MQQAACFLRLPGTLTWFMSLYSNAGYPCLLSKTCCIFIWFGAAFSWALTRLLNLMSNISLQLYNLSRFLQLSGKSYWRIFTAPPSVRLYAPRPMYLKNAPHAAKPRATWTVVRYVGRWNIIQTPTQTDLLTPDIREFLFMNLVSALPGHGFITPSYSPHTRICDSLMVQCSTNISAVLPSSSLQ